LRKRENGEGGKKSNLAILRTHQPTSASNFPRRRTVLAKKSAATAKEEKLPCRPAEERGGGMVKRNGPYKNKKGYSRGRASRNPNVKL